MRGRPPWQCFYDVDALIVVDDHPMARRTVVHPLFEAAHHLCGDLFEECVEFLQVSRVAGAAPVRGPDPESGCQRARLSASAGDAYAERSGLAVTRQSAFLRRGTSGTIRHATSSPPTLV